MSSLSPAPPMASKTMAPLNIKMVQASSSLTLLQQYHCYYSLQKYYGKTVINTNNTNNPKTTRNPNLHRFIHCTIVKMHCFWPNIMLIYFFCLQWEKNRPLPIPIKSQLLQQMNWLLLLKSMDRTSQQSQTQHSHPLVKMLRSCLPQLFCHIVGQLNSTII